ncbi:MAG: T9SS type A sorting domain-containing protein, partial [Bacteroidota bacterium]|nr:T9SS type A sorting domain-containing protein [Bacteroidota bacterium]
KIFKNKSTILVLQPEAFDISVLPNPVQTIFRTVIRRETVSKLFLELADVNGRVLLTKTSMAKNEILDFNISSFASGVYILSVRNTSGTLYTTFKIIKAL